MPARPRLRDSGSRRLSIKYCLSADRSRPERSFRAYAGTHSLAGSRGPLTGKRIRFKPVSVPGVRSNRLPGTVATMSLSNSFMMYSLAPACSARGYDPCRSRWCRTPPWARRRRASARWPRTQAVHHRHVPVEQDGFGHGALARVERLRAIFGLDDVEAHLFQNTARDFPNHAGSSTTRQVFIFRLLPDDGLNADRIITARIVWARFPGRDRRRGRP